MIIINNCLLVHIYLKSIITKIPSIGSGFSTELFLLSIIAS
jgi:hypothetical protein